MKKLITVITILLIITFLTVAIAETTVYITKTGTHYHRYGCRYLSRSCIAITLTQAQSRGYTPCSVCKP